MNGEKKICLYKISFFIYRLYIGIIIYFRIVNVYKIIVKDGFCGFLGMIRCMVCIDIVYDVLKWSYIFCYVSFV